MTKSCRLMVFKGHRESVNALLCEEDVHPNVLASGSDDGTCRLWDVRTTRATKCLNVKKALGTHDNFDSAVNSIAFGKVTAGTKSAYVYVAAGNKVLTFDVRQPTLVVNCGDREIFQQNKDEINVMSRHPGKHGKYLSVPDDNGDICVYDLERHCLVKTLRNKHSNICSVAPFRPNATWDLVSGGMDGLLLFWNVSLGIVQYRINLHTNVHGLGNCNAVVDNVASNVQQMFNPPLVHSLAFASNGKSFAAGLGDASIAIVDFRSKQIIRRLKHHGAAVSQVHFAAFSFQNRLLSAANDAKICMWNYRAALNLDVQDKNDKSKAQILLMVKEIALNSNPNAITTTSQQHLIVVADVTKDITAYSVVYN